VIGIRKSASEEVRTEARAIMRSLEAPRGKEVLEPRMDERPRGVAWRGRRAQCSTGTQTPPPSI
jgi:hypothetical protein